MNDFRRLQQDAAAALDDAEALQGVKIIAVNPDDELGDAAIVAAVNRALAGMEEHEGKAGLAVVVEMPEIEVNEPNVPGPQCELILPLYVFENRLVNRERNGKGNDGELAAFRVLQVLHHATFSDALILYADREAIQAAEVDKDDFSASSAWRVRLRASFGVDALGKALIPAITVAGGFATITTGTDGAAIRFTLDGSYPGRDRGLVYDAPVAVSSGETIRALSSKTGLLNSDVRTLVIT